MIVGLFGEPSALKSKLFSFLTHRGFYSCSPGNLAKLETDRNYVFESDRDTPGFLELQHSRKVSIWLGDEAGPSSGYDLVLPLSETEARAEEEVSQLLLQRMQSQARPDWDEYFIRIAQVASTRSNCIKRKVGAVIVRDKRIISTGYNGTPRGTKNCNEGGCPRCNSLAGSGTRLEECLCSHGEENAITQAAYHGTSVKGGTIYTTFAPCLMCTKMIINSGIQEVVYNVDYPLNEVVFKLFDQAGVRIRQHHLM
jgi:dCMP deaminase